MTRVSVPHFVCGFLAEQLLLTSFMGIPGVSYRQKCGRFARSVVKWRCNMEYVFIEILKYVYV